MKYLKANIKFIIVAAFCAFALACGNSPNKNSNVKNTANGKSDVVTFPANAPAGAQPPNMLGSPTAKVTIEEFADFQCPTCANVYGLLKTVLPSYGNRIKFIYRCFPLTQIHKNGYDAAVAAEAAGQQGKFFDMENQLFTNQKLWADAADARTIFESYAEKIGLDVEKFKTDSLSLTTKSRVEADMARGKAANVNSTPTIYINGKILAFQQVTSADSLRQAIDDELAKAGDQSTTAAPANMANAAPEQPANAAPAKSADAPEKPSNAVSK